MRIIKFGTPRPAGPWARTAPGGRGSVRMPYCLHTRADRRIMRSVVFFNNKGGVGKTTLACNIASQFAGLGHRVLLVD